MILSLLLLMVSSSMRGAFASLTRKDVNLFEKMTLELSLDNCDSLLINSPFQGNCDAYKLELCSLATSRALTILHNTDIREKGRSSLTFDNVNQLLEVKDNGRFKSIMSSTSCLTTIAVCDNTDDASRLIDFVRGLRLVGYRVAKTQLFVMVPSFEYGLLQKVQNISINFNVMILENGAGTVE